MLEEIKAMLGDAATAYTDLQIEIALKQAMLEIEGYCRRKLDAELEVVAQKIAIYRLQRMNTEGLASFAVSGVNENYIDGYPADIMLILNRKRKVKTL